MLLRDIQSFFLKELSDLYTLSECVEIFYIFSEKILGFNKVSSKLNKEYFVSSEQEKIFLAIISELKTGKPYQQILGEVYFYGLTFFIDENVLIPRPETEELVEIVISQLKNKKDTPLKILDIGTGSGCIPISLAKHLPKAEITSIDISPKALEVAQKNALFHNVKINFIQKDYLNEELEGIYDVIISNPPYIDTNEVAEIAPSVKNFEPNIALFAPPNHPLAFYEKIAQDCKTHLAEQGFVFLEINQKFGLETLHLLKNSLKKSLLVKDLSHNDRFIIGEK